MTLKQIQEALAEKQAAWDKAFSELEAEKRAKDLAQAQEVAQAIQEAQDTGESVSER